MEMKSQVTSFLAFAAAIMAVCAGAAFAQEAAQSPNAGAQLSAPQPAPAPAINAPTPAPEGPAPKIVCPDPEFDFGEKDEDVSVEHEFVIRNEGETPLEITNVRTSCGCTAAKPKDSTVAPGSETRIAATLSLRGRQGENAKTITVMSNDPVTPNLVLTMKGVVTAPIMYEPRVLNFGKVIDDNINPQTVVLRAPKEDFEITSVTSSLDFVKAEYKELEPKRAYEISAHIDKLPTAGQQTGMLTIETTHPTRPRVMVAVYADVVGPLDISPPTIAVRYSEDPNQKITQVLRVGPGTVKEFEVKEVVVPDERVGVELMPRPQSQWLIKLIDMPCDDSLEGKELIVYTTAEQMPEVRIPFRVIKPAQPVMPAPGSLNRALSQGAAAAQRGQGVRAVQGPAFTDGAAPAPAAQAPGDKNAPQQ